MIEYIQKAIDIADHYNQFEDNNELIKEIQKSHALNHNQAVQTARSICKVLCFWIEASAKGLFDMPFSEYYETCINKFYVRKNNVDDCFTYLTLDLFMLAKRFDLQIKEIRNFEEFENHKKDDEFLGTVRISTRSGMHSMICYRDNSGKIKIADTGRRGIGVPAFEHIDADNFQYYTEFIV